MKFLYKAVLSMVVVFFAISAISAKGATSAESMDATQRFGLGLENYLLAKQITVTEVGEVVTRQNNIAVRLEYTTKRIKNNKILFLSSTSFNKNDEKSLFNINLGEQVLVVGKQVSYRCANKFKNKQVVSYGEVEAFESLNHLQKAKNIDVKSFLPLLVNSSSINLNNSTAPVYDASSKSFSYKLALNAKECSEGFLSLAKAKLETQPFIKQFAEKAVLEMQTAVLNVVQNENGRFEKIGIDLSYTIKVNATLKLNMIVTQNSEISFTNSAENIVNF